MKRKPTEEEKEKELHRLRHLETCFLTLYVALMIGGLTLSITLDENSDFQKISFIIFIFSLLFSVNHLRAIVINDLRARINAFMWDVGYFFMLGIVFVVSVITRILLSFRDIYPSVDFAFISLVSAMIIMIIGLLFAQDYIKKKIHPAFRKKVLPALSYYKHLDNPLMGKKLKKK